MLSLVKKNLTFTSQTKVGCSKLSSFIPKFHCQKSCVVQWLWYSLTYYVLDITFVFILDCFETKSNKILPKKKYSRCPQTNSGVLKVTILKLNKNYVQCFNMYFKLTSCGFFKHSKYVHHKWHGKDSNKNVLLSRCWQRFLGRFKNRSWWFFFRGDLNLDIFKKQISYFTCHQKKRF